MSKTVRVRIAVPKPRHHGLAAARAAMRRWEDAMVKFARWARHAAPTIEGSVSDE